MAFLTLLVLAPATPGRAATYTEPFARACAHGSDTIAVVRRDLDGTRHGVRRWC